MNKLRDKKFLGWYNSYCEHLDQQDHIKGNEVPMSFISNIAKKFNIRIQVYVSRSDILGFPKKAWTWFKGIFS
jgi:hypothetical protein